MLINDGNYDITPGIILRFCTNGVRKNGVKK
jgi:hypothetical protein